MEHSCSAFNKKTRLPCMMRAKKHGLCGLHLNCAINIGYGKFMLDQTIIKHSNELSELNDRIMGNVMPDDPEYESLAEQLQVARDEISRKHTEEKLSIRN